MRDHLGYNVYVGYGFSVCEILPHLCFQCSVKTFNDSGVGLLVVSGKEVHVVFFEKLLKYSVDKFSSSTGYMEERDPKNRANFLPKIECDSAKPNVRSRKDIYLTGPKNCLR
jgi:hypothetical protein